MISYARIDEVSIEGATFQVQPVPDGVWRTIRLSGLAALRAAKRRALLDLRAAGDDATAEAVDDLAFLDPAYRTEIERLERDAVAWGVAGHSGLSFEFRAEERPFFGRTYRGASLATVSDYADTAIPGGRLLHALYLAVLAKNDLPAAEKKSSPPPSPAAPGDGTATTA